MDKTSKQAKGENSTSKSEYDLNLIFKLAETQHHELISDIENELKSRWVWGKDRVYLVSFKSLLEMAWRNTKSSISNLLAIGEIEERVANLEEIVEKIAETIEADLPSIKSQIAKLRKQKPTIPTHLQNYLNEVRAYVEEWRELRRRYIRSNR